MALWLLGMNFLDTWSESTLVRWDLDSVGADNARPHVARVCRLFPEDEGINTVDWLASTFTRPQPSRSPLGLWCFGPSACSSHCLGAQWRPGPEQGEKIPQKTITRSIWIMFDFTNYCFKLLSIILIFFFFLHYCCIIFLSTKNLCAETALSQMVHDEETLLLLKTFTFVLYWTRAANGYRFDFF